MTGGPPLNFFSVLLHRHDHHALEALEIFDHKQLFSQGRVQVLRDRRELPHVAVDVQQVRHDQRLDQVFESPADLKKKNVRN